MSPVEANVTDAAHARISWFSRAGVQTQRDRPAPTVLLPPPASVQAVRGRGQVTVAWTPVEGAVGYLVHRAASADGPFQPVDQGGGDLLAVPHGPYLDTTFDPDGDSWYAVSSLASIEADDGARSMPVAPDRGTQEGRIELRVQVDQVVGEVARPWRPIIGSEHLALLLQGPGPGGHHVGDELAEAFRIVHRELGVQSVRAHAILHDTLGVYRDTDAGAIHDFTKVGEVFDRLLATGLRPIVELSFTPNDLASDPDATVFGYAGNISPPRDLARWGALIRDLTVFLADRYGRDEVRRWAFEVWNEANLALFWSGTQADYLALYDASAAAVKSVDHGFRIGGPATAAAGWIDDFLAHCQANGVPVDFVSSHTYGLAPLDLRPIADRYERPDMPLWWTEWGVSPRHGASINDSPWAAPLVARGMRSAAGRLEALAYWVASDHFVELGEAPTLFHGGFGLLTIGNLRKPRYWAIAMLERLLDNELACTVTGDGAGSLVEVWATGAPDGRVSVALWNGTMDHDRGIGDPALDRSVSMSIEGLGAGVYDLCHYRVDTEHSNIVTTWERLGAPDWPDEAGWAELRAADRLELVEPQRQVQPGDGHLEIAFELPMPSVSLLELIPCDSGD
ncbi:MAG: xylan 1,4-beta-xylosidase [Chloroflexota bacterium]